MSIVLLKRLLGYAIHPYDADSLIDVPV